MVSLLSLAMNHGDGILSAAWFCFFDFDFLDCRVDFLFLFSRDVGIMDEIDTDGSGKIDYTEFLAATIGKNLYAQTDACWIAFRVFDRDGDGKITEEEIANVHYYTVWIGEERISYHPWYRYSACSCVASRSRGAFLVHQVEINRRVAKLH